MPLFKLGNTKVPHRKNTALSESVRMPAQASVLIPLSQHIGAPAAPTVKVGDEVFVGTLIGEATGFVSAPVHSSVSGKVTKIEELLNPQGRGVVAVRIESDGNMTPDPSLTAPTVTTLDELVEAARACGLVGLGGAGFPTAVKLAAAKSGKIDRIILNGAECEPYITSDTRTMLEDADLVADGVRLFLSLIPEARAIIGIEKNKPECISAMREALANEARAEVSELITRYPQGAEKVLVYNVTDRVVPEGKLPSDVGCIVINVTTVAALMRYIATGMPLTEKRVTLDGSAVKNPMNIIVPVGTSIKDIVEFAGGYSEEPGKILLGGPMMGVALYTDEYPIMKNTNAVVVMNKRDAEPKRTVACIHCGRCVMACPMGLNPTAFAKALNVDDHTDRAERLLAAKINICMECGCCSYVCPSARPLVENNRMAKNELREYLAAEKKK